MIHNGNNVIEDVDGKTVGTNTTPESYNALASQIYGNLTDEDGTSHQVTATLEDDGHVALDVSIRDLPAGGLDINVANVGGVAVSGAIDTNAGTVPVIGGGSQVAPFVISYMNVLDGGNNAIPVGGTGITLGGEAMWTDIQAYNGVGVGNDNPFIITQSNGQSTDNYTTTGDGAIVTATSVPKQNFSFTVNPDDPASIGLTWDIRLQASLDNVVFTDIGQHTNITGAGVLVVVSNSPCTYYRTSCVGLVLGATATFVDVPVLAM